MKHARVTDARMPPFCWQDKSAIRLIRRSFKASEVATALAIYLTLTELASNNESDEFKVRRATIGDRVGRSSLRSVDKYLDRLAGIGLVDKRPLTRDNEYRCMIIRLLTTPKEDAKEGRDSDGVVQSTAPPPQPAAEVAQPVATPSATDCSTPCSPVPIESEEHTLTKNTPSENASPPSADVADISGAKTEAEPHLERRGGSAGGADAGNLRGEAFRSDGGGSGIRVPGEDDEPVDKWGRKRRNGKAKKKGIYDPDRPINKWRSQDAIGYFQLKFRELWPDAGAPEADEKTRFAVQHRLDWLENEGIGRGMMREAIDTLLARWDNGLRERLNWKKAHPSFALLASARWFESLVREAQGGVPGRHDEYNSEAAKDQPSVGWGD